MSNKILMNNSENRIIKAELNDLYERIPEAKARLEHITERTNNPNGIDYIPSAMAVRSIIKG